MLWADKDLPVAVAQASRASTAELRENDMLDLLEVDSEFGARPKLLSRKSCTAKPEFATVYHQRTYPQHPDDFPPPSPRRIPWDAVRDVLLPIAPWTETPGTFVNAEGRVQSAAPFSADHDFDVC